MWFNAFEVGRGLVVARRRQLLRWMNYSIAGGPVRRAPMAEWQGGERYGDEGDDLYAEYRGTVHGAQPGEVAVMSGWSAAICSNSSCRPPGPP